MMRRATRVSWAVVVTGSMLTLAFAVRSPAQEASVAQAAAQLTTSQADTDDMASTTSLDEEVNRGPEEVNSGNLSFSSTADWVSAYFFRGIAQENQGFIFQPSAEVGVNLYANETSIFSSLDLSLGTWNSFHWGSATPSTRGWYESDLYSGLSATLGPVETGFTYTYLASPQAGGFFSEEITLSAGLSDQDMTGLSFGLNPYADLIFEVDGGSDLGSNQGTLLILGMEPEFSFPVVPDEGYDVSLSIPTLIALNLGNYYEDGTGGDDAFGYVDLGLKAGMSLPFVPAQYGQLSLTGQIHVLFLGDSVANIGNRINGGVTPTGREVEVWGGIGLTLDY